MIGTFETWEIVCLGIIGLGLVILCILTWIERKNRRKPPQDHYFLDRKDVENEDDLPL